MNKEDKETLPSGAPMPEPDFKWKAIPMKHGRPFYQKLQDTDWYWINDDGVEVNLTNGKKVETKECTYEEFQKRSEES